MDSGIMGSESKSNWRREALIEYQQLRKIKLAERDQALAEVQRFETAADMLLQEVRELDNAARTLGVIPDTPKPDEPAEDAGSEEANFKDLVIEALKRVHPKPLRAAEIRAAVERQTRKKFHPKTAGMTLYRLSKDHIVRRNGWDWHWVSEEEQSQLRYLAEADKLPLNDEDYEGPGEGDEMLN